MTFPFSWRSPCAKELTLTAPKKLVAVSASKWSWKHLSWWHKRGNDGDVNDVLWWINSKTIDYICSFFSLQLLCLSLLWMLRLWAGNHVNNYTSACMSKSIKKSTKRWQIIFKSVQRSLTDTSRISISVCSTECNKSKLYMHDTCITIIHTYMHIMYIYIHIICISD